MHRSTGSGVPARARQMRAKPSGDVAARTVNHGQRAALNLGDGLTRSHHTGPVGTLKVATRVRIPLGVPEQERGQTPRQTGRGLRGLRRAAGRATLSPAWRTVLGRWGASDSSLRAMAAPGRHRSWPLDRHAALGDQDRRGDREAGRAAPGERLGGRTPRAGRSASAQDLRRLGRAVDRFEGASLATQHAPGAPPDRCPQSAAAARRRRCEDHDPHP
jgi:hypothetical protein